MKVEVIPIGTSALAFKGETTCFVIRIDGVTILIDCGTATARGLADAGVSMTDVQAIFVSHVHADHMQALPSLVFTRSVQARAAQEPVPLLTIVAGDGVIDRAKLAVDLFYPDRKFDVAWASSLSMPGATGPLDLQPFAVQHTVASYGLRIEYSGIPVLGYSSDTALCDELIEGMRGVKVAIIEAFGTVAKFGDMAKSAKHLSAEDASSVVAAIGPMAAVPYHMHAPYQDPGDDRVELLAELKGSSAASCWVYPETSAPLTFEV